MEETSDVEQATTIVSVPVVQAEKKSAVQSIRKDSFDNLTEAALQSLPTQSQVRNSPSGTHDTPKEVLKASEELSKVEDEMKKDSSKVTKGVAFFNACARVEDTPKSLRSVCLRKAWDWSKKSNANPASDNDIPEDVKNMAKFLAE